MNILKTIYTYSVPYQIALFFVITFSSCIKEKIDLDKVSSESSIKGTFMVPLAYGELTMKEIIESNDSLSLVKFYPQDSFLYIKYKQELITQTAGDFVQLKDQNFVEVIQSNYPGFPPVFPATFSSTVYKDFGVTNGEEIDSVFLKSGTLSLSVQSTFHNTGKIVFTIPNLTKNGKPLADSVDITSATGNFVSAPKNISLDGYKFKVLENNNRNKVKIIYKVTLQSGGTISPSYAITITANITNPKFSFIFGYLGKRQLYNRAGTIVMNIFDVKDKSVVEFKDPHIKLYIRNSFGVPFKVDFTKLQTYSALNNIATDLVLNPATYYIDRATTPAYPEFDTIVIDKSNSNIVAAMSTVPRDLRYAFTDTINSTGKPWNFVADTSVVKSTIDVELPLEVKVKTYDYTDTLDMDLSKAIDDYSVVDSLRLFFKFENRLPLEVRPQLFLADQNKVIVDSVFKTGGLPFIKAASISSGTKTAGRVVDATPYEQQIFFDQSRIENFKKVKYAIIRVKLNTKEADQDKFVKFYLSDMIKVSIGLKVTLNAKSLDQF